MAGGAGGVEGINHGGKLGRMFGGGWGAVRWLTEGTAVSLRPVEEARETQKQASGSDDNNNIVEMHCSRSDRDGGDARGGCLLCTWPVGHRINQLSAGVARREKAAGCKILDTRRDTMIGIQV